MENEIIACKEEKKDRAKKIDVRAVYRWLV